jgi:hypothetical protein
MTSELGGSISLKVGLLTVLGKAILLFSRSLSWAKLILILGS